MRKIKILITSCLVLSLLLALSMTTVGLAEGGETGEPKRLYEITERRESNVKVYQLDNGEIQYEVYAVDVHFKQANGDYEEINNSITEQNVKEGYKFTNNENSWHAYFANNLLQNEAVRLEKDEYSIGFNLINSSEICSVQKSNSIDSSISMFDKTLSEDNRTVIYKDVYHNVDIAYTAMTNGLKEDIILRDKTAINTYTFDIELKGLESISKGEYLYLVDSSGEEVFRFEPMFMEDANGKYSEKVHYDIVKKNGKLQMIITADEAFLNESDTVFPVVIDPTVSVVLGSGSTYDSYVESRYPDKNNYLNVAVRTGKDTYHYVRRTYISFSLPTISGTVDGASLKLKLKDSEGTQRPIAYRVTEPWSSNTITWNNMANYTSTYNSGIGTHIGNDWYAFDVEDIVTRWDDGTYTNYGFCVKDYYENSTSIWGTWHSSDASSNLDKPRLLITHGTPVAVSYGWDLETRLSDPNEINTYPTAQEAYYLLDDLGYIRYIYNESTASTVRNYFAERAITFISSHGGAGRICIYDSSGNKTRLSGDISSDSTAYSLESRYGSGTYTMDPSLLIVFAGCSTADISTTYGDLLARAAQYGADCAVGFTDTIYIGANSSEVWAEALFTELDNGDTISVALFDARYAVWNHNSQNNYYGYQNYDIHGAVSSPGNVTVSPAQYGE